MLKAFNQYLFLTILISILLGFSALSVSRSLKTGAIDADTLITDAITVRKPSVNDVKQINADLDIMLAAMSSGQVDIFVAKTHPALFPLLGGEDNFAKFTAEALLQLDKMGLKIISTEHQAPGPFYRAGNEMLSIVPRVSVMEIEGQRFKSTGFMVAIKNTTTNTWKYLDGSGLREDKGMLWQMFPELEPGIEFPENKAEVIEERP